MTISTIDESQRKATRVVGFAYLFALVPAVFAEFFAQHAPQVRLTVVLMLLTIVDAQVLAAALAMILYVLLRRVSRNLALLAAFMRVTFLLYYKELEILID